MENAPSNGDEPCRYCSGTGVITVDAFTPSRGHFTIEEPCDCRRDRDYDDREPEDLGPLERGCPWRKDAG
jgi:hypothetical protein